MFFCETLYKEVIPVYFFFIYFSYFVYTFSIVVGTKIVIVKKIVKIIFRFSVQTIQYVIVLCRQYNNKRAKQAIANG